MNWIYIVPVIASLVACISPRDAVRDELKNNPDLLFSVIKENPEKFIETVNVAAQEVQRKQYAKQYEKKNKQINEDLANPKRPEIDASRRLVGSASDKILIVEYSDFQCPACKMAHKELKKFKQRYKNKFQFYHKNMPLNFHKMAMPAAKYFEAVAEIDKSKAKKLYDHLYENQSSLTDPGFLEKSIIKIGLPLNKVKSIADSKRVSDKIYQDMQEFEKFGFTGTPVIILNGVALSGAQGVEELERVLNLTVEGGI